MSQKVRSASPLRSPADTHSVALEPISTTGHRIESQIRGFQDLVEHGADGKSLKAGPQLVLPIEGFGQTAQRTGRLLETLQVLQFVGQTRLQFQERAMLLLCFGAMP